MNPDDVRIGILLAGAILLFGGGIIFTPVVILVGAFLIAFSIFLRPPKALPHITTPDLSSYDPPGLTKILSDYKNDLEADTDAFIARIDDAFTDRSNPSIPSDLQIALDNFAGNRDIKALGARLANLEARAKEARRKLDKPLGVRYCKCGPSRSELIIYTDHRDRVCLDCGGAVTPGMLQAEKFEPLRPLKSNAPIDVADADAYAWNDAPSIFDKCPDLERPKR